MNVIQQPLPAALGESDAFLGLQEHISRAARIDRPLVLIGERGTGKELAAQRLHLLSGRWNKPYVTLNCSSLAPSLIESELFGHEAGAFTGAARRRSGRFEQAHEGTLFLDEIADLPRTAQEKILRVVEYGQLQRVGGEETVRVDVRLIAATHRDLPRLARQGRFRADLLDRLAFDVIRLPPLRQRHTDILLLAEHFAQAMANELHLHGKPAFSAAVRARLLQHTWPGNIRELKNAIERAVARSEGTLIDNIDLDPFGTLDSRENTDTTQPEIPSTRQQDPATQPEEATQSAGTLHEEWRQLPLEEAVDRLRIWRLRDALETQRYNQRNAARVLGLTYHQFRGLYRKYESALTVAETSRPTPRT